MRRRMYVDTHRIETTALNYVVQGSARDLFCQGLSQAVRAGLGPYLALGVHDEIIAVVPEDHADECLRTLVGAMTIQFGDVPITASGEISGRSWRGKE